MEAAIQPWKTNLTSLGKTIIGESTILLKYSTEIVQQNHFTLRWALCEGVLSDKSCVCPFRTPSQLEAEEEEEWCDRQLVGGVRPFLKSGNITSGLRKKCTTFYL